MPDAITIGNVTANPGEVQRGGIPIMGDMYGRQREIPIIVYHGAEAGPILWLNGATHGDEPEGPFSIFKALQQIDAQALRGCGLKRAQISARARPGFERHGGHSGGGAGGCALRGPGCGADAPHTCHRC